MPRTPTVPAGARQSYSAVDSGRAPGYPAPSNNRASLASPPLGYSDYSPEHTPLQSPYASRGPRPAAERSESTFFGKETPYQSVDALAASEKGSSPRRSRVSAAAAGRSRQSFYQRHRKLLLALGVLAVIIVAAAVVGGILGSKSSNSSSSGSQNPAAAIANGSSASATATASSAAATPTVPAVPTQGGDGSTVISIDGTQTFRYNNSYGGFWVSTPFNDSAQAQDDVPPLNQPWDYAKNTLRGVNIGGWLNTEPFIAPALYQPFANADTPAVDEWTLFTNLDGVSSTNKATVMNRHYSTFITEADFAQIAGNGLNWVRIPVPFYMFEVYPNEPFMTGQWQYLLKAFEWARKYGIRVNVDIHSCPGSQNGYNHSGRGFKGINCLKGDMGYANAQRLLNYIRTLTQFISQPQYVNVVPMITILNEPMAATGSGQNGMGQAALQSFYARAYSTIRSISGTGQGKGPMIVIGDGFIGNTAWQSWLPNADRVALDNHLYMVFVTPQPQGSINNFAQNACAYTSQMRQAMKYGMAFGGEWSLAVNDCGQYVNGVGFGTRWEGTYLTTTVSGSCSDWTDATTWSTAKKQSIQGLAAAWLDALQHQFFWTWKIGPTTSGKVASPLWSMQLAIQQGYWVSNIRNISGYCSRLSGAAANAPFFTGPFSAAQTGGAGAPAVASSALAQYPWPPALLNADQTYSYTATQKPITMPAYTPPASLSYSGTIGNGWAVASDTASFYTPAANTQYADAWNVQEDPIILRRGPQPTPAPVA